MKQLISISIIVLMMFPSIRNFIIITDFQLNRFTIAQEYCENLEVDENCQGTCHLVKTIKKDIPEEKNSPFTANDNVKSELFVITPEKSNSPSIYSIRSLPFSYLLNDFDAHPSAVFHPPKSSFFC